MPIQTKRTGSDSVEISADEAVYYVVAFRPSFKDWVVRRYERGLVETAVQIGKYLDAEAAVTAVKTMLSEKETELTAALDKLL